MSSSGTDEQGKGAATPDNAEQQKIVSQLIDQASPAKVDGDGGTWTVRKRKNFDLSNPYGDQR